VSILNGGRTSGGVGVGTVFDTGSGAVLGCAQASAINSGTAGLTSFLIDPAFLWTSPPGFDGE
jgi:hypothetical protein